MEKAEENKFLEHFEALQNDVHRNAAEHGWWEGERNDGELIALCHSELSEMLEGLRAGNGPSDKLGGLNYSQAEEEAADVVIRLMDMCQARGWDLAGAIVEKHRYNCDRPYRHGGKKF